ncbi:MAG: aldehyde ferredoxin oxidoreductase family protein [Candidatus Lokiarchaeota archaeon]|nr:aldehyde ferredoxin oxidoreductase family protein [Candidatus Lokiarchaeota archaeon]
MDIKSLEENIARAYLGGAGLSAKIIYDLLKKEDYEELKINPFSPINPLVFATGPVTGSTRPASGRYSVCAISPLTNQWGESTSGGYFCIALHNSGFDALVITGKAKNPVFLYVENAEIQFQDASNIWGMDTYETQKAIKDKLQSDQIKIACCGVAGENLVRYACVINDEGRAAGRCGMGAVMGSKNLKAIAIRSSTMPKIASPKEITEHRKKIDFLLEDDLVASILPKVFNIFGTNSYMDMGMFAGDVPSYYFTENEFSAELLTSKTLKEQFPMFITGCAGCTLKCAKQTIVPYEGKEIRVDGPEYESMASYGSLTGVFDPKSVILAHHFGNVYGMDTISSGVSIAFLIYLVENNLATRRIRKRLKYTILEEIRWGNPNLILKLLKLIQERKGIGDLLAEGVKRMAEILEVDSELAAHVKGLEIPMHDPRAYAGQALSYMTCCVGANHEKCDWFQVESQAIIFPEYEINPGDKYDITGREAGVIAFQDIRAIDDSAVNCSFETPPKVSDIAKYISLATGFRYSPQSILQMGERMTNIKRLISCNMGITRRDDRLPTHVLQVFDHGPTGGVDLHLEENLRTYYKLRGWDWETGKPTTERLEELGIIGKGVELQAEKEKLRITPEELQKMEQLKEKYIPLLKDHNMPSEGMFEYIQFVCLYAQSERDFLEEFGTVNEGIQLIIQDKPEDEWIWMSLDNGDFTAGKGNLAKPSLTLSFRTQEVFDDIMNMNLNPVSAVLSNRLKVKPIGKVKIFQNFMGLYLDKFGLKF